MKITAASAPNATAILAALRCERTGCVCRRSHARGAGNTHCPTHEDAHPSLTVTPTDAVVLVHCQAGCSQDQVLDRLKSTGLWPDARRPDDGHAGARGDKEVRRWAYVTAEGELLAWHCRRDRPDGGKAIWWERPDGSPAKGEIAPSELPLYGLRDVLTNDVPVVLVEGEPCVDTLREHGIAAASLAGGAGQREFGSALDALYGRTVYLWPDSDNVGRELMLRVANALGTRADVRWLQVPDLPPKGDAVDFFRAGRTIDELRRLMEIAPAPDVPAVSAPAISTVPPFPVDALPPVMRRLVEEGASAMDCPPDLVAVPSLAITAGVLGNLYRIQLKLGWEQRAILWTAVVGVPGSAKTPAADIAQAPLNTLQREAHDIFKEGLAGYEEDLKAWQDAKKGERGPKPIRPEPEHYFSADSTIEGVARALGADASRTPGFVMVRDELVGWVLSFDAYRAGKGGDRQTWLSFWAGKPFKSDRAGRDPIYIPEPSVSVTGGVQPDKLTDLQEEAGQRDGFLERILWCYPDTWPMAWTEATVSGEAINAMVRAYRDLRRGNGEAPVQLMAAAKALFVAWHGENAAQTARVQGLVAGVYAKLPNQLARLALILHCLAHPAAPTAWRVSAETMAAAIEVVEYFRAHAHRVLLRFGAAAITGSALGGRIWRVLRRHGDWMSLTDQRRALGGHVDADAHRVALSELERSHLVVGRALASGEQGGRPREEWRALGVAEGAETVETAQTGEATALRIAQEGVSTVSTVLAQQPAMTCSTCGGSVDERGVCWTCNERPCVECGEGTGSAMRRFCFRCTARSGQNSAE